MVQVSSDELLDLADTHQRMIEKSLPRDPTERFVLFVDLSRYLDVVSVATDPEPQSRQDAVRYEFLQSGWNLAAALLLTPLNQWQEFPNKPYVREHQAILNQILWHLGAFVFIRKVAGWVRAGFMKAERRGKRIVLTSSPLFGGMRADELERERFELLRLTLITPDSKMERKFVRPDIDELMRPLVRPWAMSKNKMIEYGATPEIDNHFGYLAARDAGRWREDAGLHPSVKIAGIEGDVVASLIVLLTSIRLKHINFVRVARQQFPDISAAQSLMIWSPRSEMITDFALYTGYSPELVARALDAITLKASEAHQLQRVITRIRPPAIDLGNDLFLFPASSFMWNPFKMAMSLQLMRDPNMSTRFASPREDWLRGLLYDLFGDERFRCVEGNVRVRREGRILTDIDGVIFQPDANTLGLFQLKWQDFATQEPREVVSKATNFMRTMGEWTEAVQTWLSETDVQGLRDTFRIPEIRDDRPLKVVLFGLAHSAARLASYTRQKTPEGVALANWPQFARARHEIGAVEDPLVALYDRLSGEYHRQIDSRAAPTDVRIGALRFHLANYWLTYETAPDRNDQTSA